MATLEFNFEGSIIKIKCSLNERIEEAIKKFIKEAKQKKEDLYFFYGGSFLNENLPFNKLANKADQERKTPAIHGVAAPRRKARDSAIADSAETYRTEYSSPRASHNSSYSA